jgi:serine protease Do
MKRGMFFALLSAALVSALAIVLVAVAFVQPRLFRGWLFAGPGTGRAMEHASNAEIVARSNPGVVTIIATRAERSVTALSQDDELTPEQGAPPDRAPDLRPQRGYGTGFIIDAAGYIVTNDHVIKDAERIKVKLADGRERKAVVQGTDRVTDIALLKIEAADLLVLPLGDSDAVRVGDPVIAIGNPLDYEHSVTSGIVSAKGRKVYNDPPFEEYIQTDAAINRGNSGGPLLNLAGEVIGVNTIIRVDGHGISFAIPSNMVKRVVAQLRTQGFVTRGFLGLVPQNLTPELRDGLELGRVQGVLVASVSPDTAAARAGLQTYDIITRFNDRAIQSTDEFFSTVANTLPQREVELEIVRNGKMLRLRATLDQRPEPVVTRQNDPALRPQPAVRPGFSVRDNTPENQRALRVSGWTGEVTGGVIISEVNPLSAAADAGLAVGQVIVEANRRPIHNVEEFQRVMDRLQDGGALVLRIGVPHQRNLSLVAIRVGEER